MSYPRALDIAERRPLPRKTKGGITVAAAREHLRFCNSYTRLETIIKLHTRRGLPRPDTLTLLGEEWSGCDNVSGCIVLLDLLLPDGTAPGMMDDAERAALAALPETVTIYRGADRGVNESGLCWSLDRATAERFPFYTRYRATNPVLVTAQVRREDIIALKLDRTEAEIITKRPCVSSVVDLTKGGA